jgi:hypothetical protein
MESLPPSVRLMILDACRDDPYPASTEARATSRQRRDYVSPTVPNTIVMFANGPGLAIPDRLPDTLASPFTDALVSTLDYSTGDIIDIFKAVQERMKVLNPKQVPEIQISPLDKPVTLKAADPTKIPNKLDILWVQAKQYYDERSIEDFRDVIDRARALATRDDLKQRLDQEQAFADAAIKARNTDHNDKQSAAQYWRQAYALFPTRTWLALNAAIDFLMADKVPDAIELLSPVAAASNGPDASEAQRILDGLRATLPGISPRAETSIANGLILGPEFAPWKNQP